MRGDINIRAIGEIEDLQKLITELKVPYPNLFTSGLFKNNKGDIGYRCYINLRVGSQK